MVPKALFSKAKKTMIVILLITFLSGGNYFAMLLFWPTQVYNVYGMSLTFQILSELIGKQGTTTSKSAFDPFRSASVSSSAQPSASFLFPSLEVAFDF